jgi:DNA adenine methylase
MSGEPAPRPVLKWAGGKRRLLTSILRQLPERIETYFEPFVGGGAVFFALAGERRFVRAVLSDRNRELVEMYTALRDDVEGVVRVLVEHQERHSEDHYYRVRSERPRSAVRRAARVIYLNKTGYNGLYRVNRSGEFNVPLGRYTNPKICDPPRLLAASRVLSGIDIRCADFESVCADAAPGDAVYFDPPYLPLSRTANFSAYDPYPFGLSEHERLARVFAGLGEQGVVAVLSNSSAPQTRGLYAHFERRFIPVTRPINSVPERRGGVKEILVVNKRRRSAAKRSKAG